ncbi:MAG: TrkA family potassium uptake protein, partial [Ignavibacteria bacterium]|nr:TrkA family potassium uptake protein [Ignavibacteria bacterium]
MRKKFAVIGLGDFGWSVAISLAERNAEVVAIDQDIEIIDEIKDKVTYAVRLNSTDEKALRSLGLESIDAVIVSIGTNFENTILTSVLLMNLGVKMVIARAASKIQETILKKLGVHQVINPELEIAAKVSTSLINEDVLDYLDLGDGHAIFQIKTPKEFVGKSLNEIELRIRFNVNLITIKRQHKIENEETSKTEFHERIYGVPTASTIIDENDKLVLFGREKDIKKIL